MLRVFDLNLSFYKINLKHYLIELASHTLPEILITLLNKVLYNIIPFSTLEMHNKVGIP